MSEMLNQQPAEQAAAAEPVKKPKRPKSKSQLMAAAVLDKAYQDTLDAKVRGEKIGWATSLFPQEIAETLGLHIVYPENHGAAIAAKKMAAPFLEYAEAHGCNNDLCSYAKIDLAYADTLFCEASNMAKPDFLLVANNGCNEITKWFELLGRKYNIPIFMIDMTYNHKWGVTDSRVQYIKAQIEKVIENLAAYTGTTWDQDRFAEIMRISTENRTLWEQVADYLAIEPSPISGFDLFNYMGPMVFSRGRKETGDVLRQLIAETEEHIKNGTSTYPAKEEFRIFWEGIACWPYLSHNLKTLKKYGINLVATAYARAWSLDYTPGDIESLARAYSFTSSNNILIDESVRRRKEWNEKFHVDGTIYHVNRACKVMVCQQRALMKAVSEACGNLPYMAFDGDQADFRNFSEAQFETRIEAFAEMMRKHKEEVRNG